MALEIVGWTHVEDNLCHCGKVNDVIVDEDGDYYPAHYDCIAHNVSRDYVAEVLVRALQTRLRG